MDRRGVRFIIHQNGGPRIQRNEAPPTPPPPPPVKPVPLACCDPGKTSHHKPAKPAKRFTQMDGMDGSWKEFYGLLDGNPVDTLTY